VCCWLWTLCHTTQHGAVLIIFPLNLQTITITRMLSSGGEGHLRLSAQPISLGFNHQTSSADLWCTSLPPQSDSLQPRYNYLTVTLFRNRSMSKATAVANEVQMSQLLPSKKLGENMDEQNIAVNFSSSIWDSTSNDWLYNN